MADFDENKKFYPNADILKACQEGKTATLQKWIASAKAAGKDYLLESTSFGHGGVADEKFKDRTPLQVAIMHGQKDVVKLFIKEGIYYPGSSLSAIMDSPEIFPRALRLAVEANKPEMIPILLGDDRENTRSITTQAWLLATSAAIKKGDATLVQPFIDDLKKIKKPSLRMEGYASLLENAAEKPDMIALLKKEMPEYKELTQVLLEKKERTRHFTPSYNRPSDAPTPLEQAISASDTRQMNVLLKVASGEDIKKVLETMFPPPSYPQQDTAEQDKAANLRMALFAQKDMLAPVIAEIKNHRTVVEQQKDFRTLMENAISHDNKDAVALLLDTQPDDRKKALLAYAIDSALQYDVHSKVAAALLQDRNKGGFKPEGIKLAELGLDATKISHHLGDAITHGYKQKFDVLLQHGLNDGILKGETGARLLMKALEAAKDAPEKKAEYDKMVMQLIERGADIYATDNMHSSPIEYLIKYNRTDLLQKLTVDPNKTLREGEYSNTNLFAYAIGQGKPEMVKALIEKGADLNKIIKSDGRHGETTPLMLAVKLRNPEVIAVLLDKGAELNKDIVLAAQKDGNASTIEVLVQRIIKDKKETEYDLPGILTYAARNEQTEIMNMLLDKKYVGINDKNKDGETALMATAHIYEYRVKEGEMQARKNAALKTLLSRHPDISLADKKGKTALCHHALAGNADAVAELVKLGADINARLSVKQDYGDAFTEKTILEQAIDEYNYKAAAIVIKQGAKIPDKGDYSAENLIARTVKSADPSITQEMLANILESTRDPAQKKKYALKALMSAIEYNKPELVKSLLAQDKTLAQGDDNNDPLGTAATYESTEMVEALLSAGADPNQKTGAYGASPLLTAAERGNQRIFEALVKAGAKIDHIDAIGRNALRYAVNGKPEFLTWLLDTHGSKFDINAIVDRGERTPLTIAAESGKEDIAKILLAKGAKIDQADSRGITAFMSAAEYGKVNILKLFLTQEPTKKEALLNAENKDGYSALLLAASKGNTGAVEFLIKEGAALKNSQGRTVLSAAVHTYPYNMDSVVSTLLKTHNELLNMADNKGITPLMESMGFAPIPVIKKLVDQGANITASDNDGNTAFMHAVRLGRKEAVEYFINEKKLGTADFTLQNKDGHNALMLAAYHGNDTVFKMLLEKGAQIDPKDQDKWQAILDNPANHRKIPDKIKKAIQEKLPGIHIPATAQKDMANALATELNGNVSGMKAESHDQSVHLLLDTGTTSQALADELNKLAKQKGFAADKNPFEFVEATAGSGKSFIRVKPENADAVLKTLVTKEAKAAIDQANKPAVTPAPLSPSAPEQDEQEDPAVAPPPAPGITPTLGAGGPVSVTNPPAATEGAHNPSTPPPPERPKEKGFMDFLADNKGKGILGIISGAISYFLGMFGGGAGGGTDGVSGIGGNSSQPPAPTMTPALQKSVTAYANARFTDPATGVTQQEKVTQFVSRYGSMIAKNMKPEDQDKRATEIKDKIIEAAEKDKPEAMQKAMAEALTALKMTDTALIQLVGSTSVSSAGIPINAEAVKKAAQSLR